ncbi:MAG: Hsp20/alpha crystallin family protein [Planctomycetaceae bacterium]
MRSFHFGSPFEAFRDLEREVDRLLRNVGRSFEGVRFGRPYPPVNIYDLESEYLLTAELPGTKADDFELTVTRGTLTLRGRRTAEDGIAEESYRRSERPRGEWERKFTLPERVLEEQIHAELKHGILALHLPKAQASQPRQISVTEH